MHGDGRGVEWCRGGESWGGVVLLPGVLWGVVSTQVLNVVVELSESCGDGGHNCRISQHLQGVAQQCVASIRLLEFLNLLHHAEFACLHLLCGVVVAEDIGVEVALWENTWSGRKEVHFKINLL